MSNDNGPRSNSQQANGWRPPSLRTPALASILVSSTIAAIIIVILYFRNAKYGAIYTIQDVNLASELATFIFQNLPTLLAILYAASWSWIDLDVKRLEPWFQLSSRNGSTSKRSLLLQYHLDFPLAIPVRAFKYK